MSKYPRKLVVYISIIKMKIINSHAKTSAFLKIGKLCKPIHFFLSHVLISNFTSSSRYQKICVIELQEHKLDQIAARNFSISRDKPIAYSKQSYGVS